MGGGDRAEPRACPLPLLQLEGAWSREDSSLELCYPGSGWPLQMSASGGLRCPRPIPNRPEGGAQAFLWLGAKAGGQWGRGSC